MYLLPCTFPLGWVPGAPLGADTLMSTALSRRKTEITEEPCQQLAAWSGCAEAVALWEVLRMELQDAGNRRVIGQARRGAGSTWLGDSVCLYYL